jgi:hypothetical protein
MGLLSPSEILRLAQDDKFDDSQTCHFGGTGTTAPQFLQVRSFSSLENFW